MTSQVEIDNRRSELAVYEIERVRMVRDNVPADELAKWDAWGASVSVRLEAMLAGTEPVAAPVEELPTAVVTPAEDSTAYGVIHISPEEDE